MMRNHRLLFIFISLFLFTQHLQAQRPSKAEVTIKGLVFDTDAGVPLEFATITLFSKQDSSVVTGGITDAQGKFEITTQPGRLFVKVEFISYETLVIEEIPFEKGKTVIDLGVLEIGADTQMLDEVTIQAEKSTMQMALDKKIFNVGKDLANQGGSAAQILDNVPSVTVDVEGEVSLRGGSPRILVDGKPSALVRDANGLRSIPANLIERIEVITNPSARYEAEGMTGIINIVLKKNRNNGINGSFDLNIGYPDNYGAAINMNYRREKLNLFTNIGIQYRKSPGFGSNYQELLRNDTLFISDQNRDRERGGLSNNFRVGADFYLTPKDIITTSLQYRISDDNNFTEIQYQDYLFNNDVVNRYAITERTDDEEEDESNLEYALSYQKLFDKKGHELNLDVRYQDNVETESSNYEEIFFDGNRVPLDTENLRQRSNNEEGDERLLVKLDYVYPFAKEGKFEAGYLGSMRKITNSYLVEELKDDEWESLPGLTNDFSYNEAIHGLYASFGNKINKFSFQFGLRAEYSDIETELLQTNELNARDYANLFPSAFLTYDLPSNNAVQLSYSRRIRRPRFWDLNPFFTFSDARNFFSGNPNLDPEFTDAYEMGHIKYWDKGSIGSSVYYRHTEGVIQRIFAVDQATGNTIRRPENLATENSYGLEFNYSYDPVDWWRINGDFNFFRAITSGEIVDAEGVKQSLEADTYTWFTRLTSRTTWKDTDFQVRLNYRAPRENTQGKTKSVTSIDIGISKDILKNKGTITLSIQDLLNNRRYRSTQELDNFYAESDFQWRARQATLSFNYRLNQQKRRGRGNGNGGQYQGGEEF